MSVDDIVIENTDTMNVLGIHIDKMLNFNDHISYLCNNADSLWNVYPITTGGAISWLRE